MIQKAKRPSEWGWRVMKFIGVSFALFIAFIIVSTLHFACDVSKKNAIKLEKQTLEVLEISIKEYYEDTKCFPSSEADMRTYRKTHKEVYWPDDSFDVWQSKRIFIKTNDTIEIISAGPDKTFHTPDDISILIKPPKDL